MRHRRRRGVPVDEDPVAGACGWIRATERTWAAAAANRCSSILPDRIDPRPRPSRICGLRRPASASPPCSPRPAPPCSTRRRKSAHAHRLPAPETSAHSSRWIRQPPAVSASMSWTRSISVRRSPMGSRFRPSIGSPRKAARPPPTAARSSGRGRDLITCLLADLFGIRRLHPSRKPCDPAAPPRHAREANAGSAHRHP